MMLVLEALLLCVYCNTKIPLNELNNAHFLKGYVFRGIIFIYKKSIKEIMLS